MKRIKEILVWVSGLFSSKKKENWRVVLLCLAAGTTFWFLNALNKSYTTKINYPINFIYDEEDVVVVEDLPEKVEIDVSGVGWNLLRKTFWFNVQPVDVPLNNPTEVEYIIGSSLVPFISDQVNELSLNYVVTDSLFISIDNKISRKLPVRIDSTRFPLQQNNKIISPVTITPDSILFEGPSVIIDTLPSSVSVIFPDRIIENNFNGSLEIDFSAIELIQFAPDEVNVSFEIGHFVTQNMVVPIELINFPEDSSVYLSNRQVQLKFNVQEKDAEKLSTRNFKVIANLKNLKLPDSTITPLVIKYPDFVEDLTVNPSALEVINEK